MSGDLVIQMAQEALRMVLIISAPMLGLGLLVGLAVSIFQATTSIQEQTLTFLPKFGALYVLSDLFFLAHAESVTSHPLKSTVSSFAHLSTKIDSI